MLFESLDVCDRFSDYIFLILFIKFRKKLFIIIYGEFDPGSERTLAACLIHASRARKFRKG